MARYLQASVEYSLFQCKNFKQLKIRSSNFIKKYGSHVKILKMQLYILPVVI